MNGPAVSPKLVPRAFGIASFVLGLVALFGRLGFEAARADLGSDLAIDAPWIRVVLYVGSLLLALFGLVNAGAAAVCAPSWSARLGLALPGLLLNGFAILWFALWS